MPDSDAISFRYTPYDGAKRPFSIGLEPLDPPRWIEPDELLLGELAQKDELLLGRRDVVVAEREDSRAAQAEVLDALVSYLTTQHAKRYRGEGDAIVIDDVRRVDLNDESPIVSASRLVQDDLCLMRASEDGWRLVAASLCFPSAWSLAEKFDLPMSAIHAHVPGFPGQMEQRVRRIFDNLKVGAPVWRLNWSIYPDGGLHYPAAKQNTLLKPRAYDATCFVRVERQSLMKMPASGDILFTIRVYSDPLLAFGKHPRGRELAAGLRAQLLDLDADQLAYKNMAVGRDRLAEALAAL